MLTPPLLPAQNVHPHALTARIPHFASTATRTSTYTKGRALPRVPIPPQPLTPPYHASRAPPPVSIAMALSLLAPPAKTAPTSTRVTAVVWQVVPLIQL